ncbi:MAG: type II secretion system protein J [Bacteriovoracaceae bacterium]
MKKFNSTSVFSNRGFTLIEILIAITLLAFITIAVVSITDNAIHTKDRTTEINKNNLQIETAMSRFEWDFSQIYSPLYFSTVLNMNNQGLDQNGMPQGGGAANPNAQTNPMLQQYYENLAMRFQQNENFMAVSKEGIPVPRLYSPDKTVFQFFTSSNRRKIENTKQSHFAWVRYTLGDQPAKEDLPEGVPKSLKSFVRYFTADDPYSDKRMNVEDMKAAVLLEDVESLEFQFWDMNKRKWETSLTNIQDGQSIVKGVKILITWYDSLGVKRSAERIFRPHWPMALIQDQTQGAPPGGTGAPGMNGNPNGTNPGTGTGTGVNPNPGTTNGLPYGF